MLRELLENYDGMRSILSELNAQLLHSSAPMEIGLCAVKPEDGTDAEVHPPADQPTQTPWNSNQWPEIPTEVQAFLDAFKGKGSGKGKDGKGKGCRICGAMDHWARECPENPNKRKGKGPWQHKGYGMQKGKGVGKGWGKNKEKAYELTAQWNPTDWGQAPWQETPWQNHKGPLPLGSLIEKDNSIPIQNNFQMLEEDDHTGEDDEVDSHVIHTASEGPIITTSDDQEFPPLTSNLEPMIQMKKTKTQSRNQRKRDVEKKKSQSSEDAMAADPMMVPPSMPAEWSVAGSRRQKTKYRIMNTTAPGSCRDPACGDSRCQDVQAGSQNGITARHSERTAAPYPGAETIEGSEGLMKEAWRKADERRVENEAILSGNNPRKTGSSEWLKARARVLEMQTTQEVLDVLIAKKPVINAAVNRKPEWEPITIMVDSGASDSVMNPTQVPSADIQPTAGSAVGLEYEVANGESISNLGEKVLTVIPHGGRDERSLKVQCAEVHRGLLSVAQCIDNGNSVIFDKGGSYILDNNTGERTELVGEGNIFNLRLWARPGSTREGAGKDQGFQRPGKP